MERSFLPPTSLGNSVRSAHDSSPGSRTPELRIARLEADDYRLLVENAIDIVFTVDPEGRITSLNQAFETLLGWKKEEWLGKSFVPLIHAEDRDRLYAGFTRAYSGGPVRHLTGRTLRKSGDCLMIEISALPMIRNNVVVGVMGTVRDISRLHRAETESKKLRETEELSRRHAEELARSNRELGEFAYVASHDLQEPLRMVTSYLRLLQRRYSDLLGREGAEFIEHAADGACRMRQLILDLLAYSRVGRDHVINGAVNTETLIRSVLSNTEVALEESMGSVEWENLPAVRGNAVLLGQLFQNLICNSLKFRGPEAPLVQICGEENADRWLFCVKDNGIGIQTSNSDRIFMLFQRLHSRERYPGTGVGLAVCKKIVEHHGGKIWFKCPPEGGTAFYFTLLKGI